MNAPRNTDPFAPWNGFDRDDPFAPWNDPMKRDDPFAAWNDPFGHGRYEREAEIYPDRDAEGKLMFSSYAQTFQAVANVIAAGAREPRYSDLVAWERGTSPRACPKLARMVEAIFMTLDPDPNFKLSAMRRNIGNIATRNLRAARPDYSLIPLCREVLAAIDAFEAARRVRRAA